MQVSHYPDLSTGLLPVERTTQNLPFKIFGIDYAGPLIYKIETKKRRCTYHYLHIVLPEPYILNSGFIMALKRLIAR